MGLIATMESADVEVDTKDTAAVEEQLNVVTETNDIVEATSDIAGDAKEVEEGVETTEELAALGDVAQNAVDSGEGLSEDAAAAVLVATESALYRLGMRRDAIRQSLPGMESFGNSNTRMSSTVAVLLTVGETVKKVWGYIKDMAKRIWEKIRSLFARLFSSADQLEKSFKSLLAREGALKADASQSKTKIESSLAQSFEVDGAASANTLKKILENSTTLTGVVSKVSEFRLRQMGALNSAIGTNAVIDTSSFLNAWTTELNKLPTANSNLTKTNWEGVFCFGMFAGGVILTVGQTAKAEVTDSESDRIKAYGFRFEKAKELKAKEFDVFSRADIKAVANEAMTLLKEFKKLKSAEKADADGAKAMEKLSDSVIRSFEQKGSVDGKPTKEVADRAKEARVLVGTLINQANVLSGQGPALVFKAASVAYQAAAASLAVYKNKD